MNSSAMGPHERQDVSEGALDNLLKRQKFFVRLLHAKLRDYDEAEDVFQDFCIRVIRKSNQIRQGGASEGWLRAVLRSTLIDHFRSKSSKRRAERRMIADWSATSSLFELPIDEGRPLEKDDCACLYGLLPKLKREYAQAITLVDLSERAPSDVADELGIEAGTMRVRLHRARHALKKALEQSCGGCRDEGCLGPAGGGVDAGSKIYVAGTCSAASA